VEWDGAEPNGSELIRYELERAQPEDQKGGAGGGGESRENKVESMLEAVEMYTIGAEQQVCHIKDLESNKRYQFRLRAVNGVGPSEWSDAVTMDLINPTDSDTAIDFAEIEMGDVIGEGGFSVVYRGVWRNRQVAVKRLKVQYTEGGEHHAEEFKREVELLSNLRHRNIVQYIGASLQSPDPCVLTELALYSLSDLLYKHNTKLKLEQTLSYAKDVAKGVKYLHALRPMIIHRDLKSSNLLIGDRNVLKISDFGLSRIKNESVTQISGMLVLPALLPFPF
jgi:tRNA A-37 threonylcarbamoyl transferase component Bud32